MIDNLAQDWSTIWCKWSYYVKKCEVNYSKFMLGAILLMICTNATICINVRWGNQHPCWNKAKWKILRKFLFEHASITNYNTEIVISVHHNWTIIKRSNQVFSLLLWFETFSSNILKIRQCFSPRVSRPPFWNVKI